MRIPPKEGSNIRPEARDSKSCLHITTRFRKTGMKTGRVVNIAGAAVTDTGFDYEIHADKSATCSNTSNAAPQRQFRGSKREPLVSYR